MSYPLVSRSKYIFILVFTMFLSGCGSSVPMANSTIDHEEKMFFTSASNANLYIYRHEIFGSNNKVPILIDSKLAGVTIGRTYMKVPVKQGVHRIVSMSGNPSTLSIDTKANKNYFIWQEHKLGLTTNSSKLHIVSETKGKNDIQKCKLIQIERAFKK